MALTEKQRRFVSEYLVDLNATQAAIRAGFSERTARSIGSEYLTKPDIAAAIVEAQQARAERTEITQDRVLRELACMGLYDPKDLVSQPVEGPADIAKLPESVRRVIIGWAWDKFGNFVLKLSPKTPSLELIGRHLGMFTDNVNIKGSIGIDELMRAAQEYDRELAKEPERPSLN